MTYAITETPIGTLMLSAEHGAVTGVRFAESALIPERFEDTAADRALLALLIRQLSEYFQGERRQFDVPLSFTSSERPRVTPFRRAVWEAMAAIPYGEVKSYGALAAMAGYPRACRAVGNACHANPLLLLLPCHRVVASDGIGGFAGRLDVKRQLLQHEALCLKNHAEHNNAKKSLSPRNLR